MYVAFLFPKEVSPQQLQKNAYPVIESNTLKGTKTCSIYLYSNERQKRTRNHNLLKWLLSVKEHYK